MKKSLFLLLISLHALPVLHAQHIISPENTFYSLDEAYKNPEAVQKLDLSYQTLEDIPKGFSPFSNLEELIFNANKLTSLPDDIRVLQKLRHLEITHMPHLNAHQLFDPLSALENLEILKINDCKLTYVPYQIGKLQKLRELELKNNNISFLPSDMQYLISLRKLDLSHNDLRDFNREVFSWKHLNHLNISYNPGLDYEHVFEVLSRFEELEFLIINGIEVFPKSLGKLKSLRYLDISNSRMEKVNRSIKNLSKLEELILRECHGLDYTDLFEKLSFLQTLRILEIHDDQIDRLASGLYKLKHLQKISIRGKRLEVMNDDLKNINKLFVLTFKMCPKLNMGALFEQLAGIDTLYRLEFLLCEIEYIPDNISLLNTVRVLDLRSNYIQNLPQNMSEMQNFMIIDLSNNPVNTNNIRALEEAMPGVKFSYDDPKKWEVHKESLFYFHAKLGPPSSQLRLDPAKEHVITLKSGTKMYIPEQAFANTEGKVILEPIDLYYREITDPVGLSLSGIPCYYDTAGIKYLFNMSGTFECIPVLNKEILRIRPGKEIMIEQLSSCTDKEMALYFFNENTRKWSLIKYEYDHKDLEKPQTNRETENPEPGPVKDIKIQKELVYCSLPNKVKRRHFAFSVNSKAPLFNTRKDKSYFKKYSEIRILKQIQWIYAGDVYKDDYAKLKSISKRTYRGKNKNKYILPETEDLWLKQNPKGDNYILVFAGKYDTVEIPVYSDMGGKQAGQIKNRNEKFYNKYKKELDIRRKNWDSIDEEYENNFDQYQKELEEFRKTMIAHDPTLSNSHPLLEMQVKRSFQLSKPGLWTLSGIKIMNRMERKTLKFINQMNQPLKPLQLMILDFKTNTVITFNPNEEVFFDSESPNAIIVFNQNKSIGILKISEFENAFKDKSYSHTLSMNIFISQYMDAEKILNYILLP
jgi:Leucine-rich repeat (LRR) protein